VFNHGKVRRSERSARPRNYAGFLKHGDHYSTVQDPLGIAGEANGINTHGDIVGEYVDASFNVHGFVRHP
jgi:hypothetical protein